jgi:flavin-dependent dehydrogenase
MEGDTMSTNHYDVIIIGGRCAGASLALRLAGNNLKILLVDRATFPSLPSVPSAPFIHPATMRLLDELGIEESEYTHPGSKIEHFVVNMVNYFETAMPMSQMKLDRNYFCGIDRNLFDETLWKRAAKATGVTAQEGFSVTRILKDDKGAVNGIAGKPSSGEDKQYTADLVVGADGRFSFSARQFGAKVVDEKNKFTSTVYHAEWDNVDAYSAEWPHSATNYRGNGFMILMIPIAERKYHIGTATRSDHANFGAQGFEKAYYEDLQKIPHLWNRLKQAKRVSDIVGMRPIENGYREAFGSNWALVGDAVHYKDPTDGQGMYDALLGSKLLAQVIIDWKKTGISWTSAGANYQKQLLDATYATFKQTVANIKQTLYTSAPEFINKTLVRWMINSPEFQTPFLRYLSREIPAEDYKPLPRNIPQIVLNGIWTNIRHRFKRLQ